MKNIITIVLLGLTLFASAQTTNYNIKTLTLFNESKWENLITVADEAIEKNQASYEIEYRLGVAYYNLKKYFDSAMQFEKITKTYQINNEYIQEYLYYSYLFSGRTDDALLVSKNFPFHLQQKINAKHFELIDYLSAEGGIKLSSRRNIDIKNMSYFNVGLGQRLGYHVRLNHAFTRISQDYIDFDYNQNEYYINAIILASKGLLLIPAYHYISISENTVSNNNGNNQNNNSANTDNGNINIFHLALKKQWNRLTLMPNITYAKSNLVINDLEETSSNMQYGLDLGYGINHKLWLGFGANVINKDNANGFIGNTKIHYQISPKSFLYLKYTNANTSDFSDDNAMFYNNAVSLFDNKISTTFGYYLTPKFLWFINYQYETAEDLDNNLSFNYNTFITGINYNF